MGNKKRNILDALERMDYYAQANANLATEVPITVELFAANRNNIEQFHQAGITKAASASEGMSEARSKAARAREIHADLRHVVRAGKILERKKPDFKNSFTLPHGDLSYQQLFDSTASFIAAAVAVQSDLTKYSLSPAFFTKLQADADDLRNISHSQADAKRTGIGATADTDSIIADALDVREELKTALEIYYRDDPAKLAEWLTACHIRRAKKTETAAPPDEPPVPKPPTV